MKIFHVYTGNELLLTYRLVIRTGSTRSSVEESRGDEITKEDETVVDAEQGSSTSMRHTVRVGYTRKYR